MNFQHWIFCEFIGLKFVAPLMNLYVCLLIVNVDSLDIVDLFAEISMRLWKLALIKMFG